PACYSALLAGAGVRGGLVYGASDAIGGYVKDRPVTPEDFAATLFSALGVLPETRLSPDGATLPVSTGRPVLALFGCPFSRATGVPPRGPPRASRHPRTGLSTAARHPPLRLRGTLMTFVCTPPGFRLFLVTATFFLGLTPAARAELPTPVLHTVFP